jgi:phosphoribosylformylglycinamidine synthase
MKQWDAVTALMRKNVVVSAYVPGAEGAAVSAMKMAAGNGLGVLFEDKADDDLMFEAHYGAILAEIKKGAALPEDLCAVPIGTVTKKAVLERGDSSVSLKKLLKADEGRLEDVYPCNDVKAGETAAQKDLLDELEASVRKQALKDSSKAGMDASVAVHTGIVRPRFLIPVFPGTNCEYDSAKAMADAGAEPEIIVINNRTADGIARSVERFAKSLADAQMVFIPGGFSGGDEPDGSGKFITAFFRNAAVKDAVTALLDKRGGLMCGICNGFQALIKLGLVPYGKIIDADENSPTLTFNTIGRHQSRIVRTRVASNLSPWLRGVQVGDIVNVPISHGEGRFLATEALIRDLAAKGQIATQYVDFDGKASADVHFNPNGSMFAVEGITSPDGRVFGKMGHSERTGRGLYKNVPGNYDLRMFESAVRYFRG